MSLKENDAHLPNFNSRFYSIPCDFDFILIKNVVGHSLKLENSGCQTLEEVNLNTDAILEMPVQLWEMEFSRKWDFHLTTERYTNVTWDIPI